MTVAIPETVLRETARWMIDFRDYWREETPDRIHTSSLDDGGAPQWHPEFSRWIGLDYRGPKSDERWSDAPDLRLRTTRAFRKLRRKAVREFEVCYRVIVLGEPVMLTTIWLNERALRNDIPLPERGFHYDVNDTLLLLVSGIQKAISWW